VRTFVAIEISQDTKSVIAELQDKLREAEADVSWTRPDNIHLTLKFLGEVSEVLIADIARVCQECAADSPSLAFTLNGAGVFPDMRQPRVLWVGLGGDVGPLVQLQTQLDEKLSAIGFERERKPFRAHLTMGRVKSKRNSDALMTMLKESEPAPMAFNVTEIALIRSQLHPAGSRYTRLASAALQK
jgi:RNA 2',3'-cyclic 3'-phosphodiesterase